MDTGPQLIGATVGQYQIEALIGQGGMGYVYRARDTTLARSVALKVLPPEVVSDASRLSRFIQEARAASALNHPHVIAIYEIREAAPMRDGAAIAGVPSLHYLAMELVTGDTLRTLIETRRLEMKRALDLLIQVAEALAAAHAAGVVHRDLKPENIMVASSGYAKVLDFGLAKLRPDALANAGATQAVTLTAASAPGVLLGTVGYMSPEQVEGRPTDHRSDIFSYGCVAYEAVAGARAFSGHSTIETLHRIANVDPVAIAGGLTSAPAELRRIVAKCLAKNPDDRYQSLKETAIDLRSLVRQLDSGSVVSAETPRPAFITGRWALWAGAAALALAVGVMAWRWIGREPSAADAVPALAKPVNPAAYDAVQRARYLSVRTTDEDSRAAIRLLEQAIELDPGYAPAYGALAAALVTRLAYVTPEETRDLEQQAFAAAEKALSLNPDVPEAYLARGDLLWSHSHRFALERAVQEFRRALASNPNFGEAHRRLARVYVHTGFFEETIQHANIAIGINPSDAQALNSRAQATLWMGKDEEALAALLSIPGPVLPELVEANTAFALFRLGRRDEAAGHLSQAIRKHPDDPSGNLPAMRALLLAESDPRAASSLLDAVGSRKALNPSHHAAYFAASASARMRRPREAVQWLREAADTGFPCYELFARDPNLDPIRHDPQFVEFMTELQKRSAAMRKALFPDRS